MSGQEPQENQQQPKTATTLSPLRNCFFVIGGPGVGKGTACEYLARVFDLRHICAGDMLRDEVKRGTDLGKNVIGPILAEGKIVPSEVTVKLLDMRVQEALSSSSPSSTNSTNNSNSRGSTGSNDGTGASSPPPPQGLLLDGFPRKVDQAKMFEENTCKAKAVLFFECSQEEMERRLLARGRADDTLEIMRRRFAANLEQCVPVMEMYQSEARFRTINSGVPIDEVCKKCVEMFTKDLGLSIVDDTVPLPAVPSSA